MNTRGQLGACRAFALVTNGGPVGLGNSYPSSYVAGQDGGAVLLFIYLGRVLLIRLPLIIGELSPGHRGGLRLDLGIGDAAVE